MAGDGRAIRREDAAVPVVIFDRSGGAWVFRDHQDAADWMEAIDVMDGEYHGYDADGYVLSLSAVNDRVGIRRTSERVYEEAFDQLRATMSTSPVVLTADTLEEMVQQLLDKPDRPKLSARDAVKTAE